MTLLALDIFFSILHLLVTGFNLLDWIPRATRRLHRWCVAITAFCWLAAGAWVGRIGYCPLTDWHWDVKRMRGETDLPASFISYIANRLGFYPAPLHVDIAVGLAFAVIVMITIALWGRERREQR